MPQVPRYGGPQVERRPLPAVSQPTSVPQGVGGIGAQVDLGGLTGALTQEYQKQLDRFNRAEIRGAAAKLAELETRSIYDPKTGILAQRGKNALRAREILDVDFAKGASEIEASLANESQREAFRSLYETHRASLDQVVGRHTQTELAKYEAEQTEALVLNERNAAVAAAMPGVPFEEVAERVGLAVAKQRAALADLADVQGVSDEVKKQVLDTTASSTHRAVITRILNNSEQDINADQTAQKYYDATKDFIFDADKIYVEKALQEGSLLGEAQRTADALMLEYPDRRAALNAVKKIVNPKLRDAVQTRVEHEFGVQDALQRDQQEQLYLQATNIIEPYVRRGSPFLASQIVPNGIWAQLPLGARTALEKRGGDRENDARKWHTFLELTPRQLGKLNQQEFEEQYWSFFDNQTRYRAESMWQQARDQERTGKLDPRTSSDLTFRNLVTIALGTLDPVYRKKAVTKLNEQQAQFYADFTLEAMRRKEEAEEAKGKPLTTTEVQAVVDKLKTETVLVDRGFRSDPMRLPFNVQKDEQGQVYAPNVPPEEQKAIEADIRAKGKRVTERKVQRLYAAKLTNDARLRADILREP